jgi:hypothetical protein
MWNSGGKKAHERQRRTIILVIWKGKKRQEDKRR